jgi:hypothetical protein
MNDYQALMSRMGLSSGKLDQALEQFKQRLTRELGIPFALKLTGYGKGGGLLLVANANDLRDRWEEVLTFLAEAARRVKLPSSRLVRADVLGWSQGYRVDIQDELLHLRPGQGLVVEHAPDWGIISDLASRTRARTWRDDVRHVAPVCEKFRLYVRSGFPPQLDVYEGLSKEQILAKVNEISERWVVLSRPGIDVWYMGTRLPVTRRVFGFLWAIATSGEFVEYGRVKRFATRRTDIGMTPSQIRSAIRKWLLTKGWEDPDALKREAYRSLHLLVTDGFDKAQPGKLAQKIEVNTFAFECVED